jgi:tRNA(fMet)-specific endonuclease VapC
MIKRPARWVLDTNVAVAILNGEARATKRLRAQADVVMPVVVLGELLTGARNSARPEENERRLWRFVEDLTVWPCDATVASHYADIGVRLRRMGKPIPQNDQWIAAVCLAAEAALASRDVHFDQLPDLARESWS